jgi:hypothetical protein
MQLAGWLHARKYNALHRILFFPESAIINGAQTALLAKLPIANQNNFAGAEFTFLLASVTFAKSVTFTNP